MNDWTGRLIAESLTQKNVYFASFTYGRDEYGDSDHIRSAVLTYPDMQKYLKRLRRRVGKFKYFVVGEYGAEKGRAHWHAILFTAKPLAEHVQFGVRYMQEPWDYGWSYFEPFHAKHASYCCKYLYKESDEDFKISMYKMSKKPPLGAEYFAELAQKYVDQGLSPTDLFYSFPDIKKKDGTPKKFLMRGNTAERFLEEFCQRWEARYGKTLPTKEELVKGGRIRIDGKHMPHSEMLDQWLDKRIGRWWEEAEIIRDIEDYEQEKIEKEKEKYRSRKAPGADNDPHRRRPWWSKAEKAEKVRTFGPDAKGGESALNVKWTLRPRINRSAA